MHIKDIQVSANALEGRVILITGAGDGIGKSVALAAAKHGATVVLLGKTEKKLNAVYDQIVAEGGQQPAIVPLNLSGLTPENVAELASMLESEFGRLDGVLHNAAMLGVRAPFEHIAPMTWLEVMQVNVNAQFLLTQALLPLLRVSEDARLLFTTSSVGRRAKAYWGAYSISKFATEGMMQLLAAELDGTHVRVNAINPGPTRTKMRANAYPGEDPSSVKSAESLNELYVYLLSAASQAVHGQSIDA
jgi:NAD(P)-dependent dehydrogenase (short-subunit alcohol dehydrogenase family)